MNTVSFQPTWDAWREQLWSNFVQLESASDATEFYGKVVTQVPGSDRICAVSSTSQLTERTPENIRKDPQDCVLLLLQKSGQGYFEQQGTQARLCNGDFAICDTSKPYRLYFDSPFEQIVLKFPRQRVVEVMPDLDRITGLRIDGKAGPGLVVSGFIRQLYRDGAKLKDDDLTNFDNTIVQMLATAIRLSDDGSTDECHARLNRIKARLMQQIRDPYLDLVEIAAHEGMSLRTLQRLFQLEGHTPREWVSEQRLSGVAHDLRAPSEASRTITDIAYSWGFSDLSHFSRGFKSNYGVSARVWRSGN